MQNEQPEPLRRESGAPDQDEKRRTEDIEGMSEIRSTASDSSKTPAVTPSDTDSASESKKEIPGLDRNERDSAPVADPAVTTPIRATERTANGLTSPDLQTSPFERPTTASRPTGSGPGTSRTGNESAFGATAIPGSSTAPSRAPNSQAAGVPASSGPGSQRLSAPGPAASAGSQTPFLEQRPTVSAAAPVAQPTTTSAEAKEKLGLLDLAESEELLSEVDSGDDGRFILTSRRLIYQGRSSSDAVFSSASIDDVTAIEFGRRPRDSRSAWWGVVGLIAAVAVWQVTSNETVGMVAGAIVGGMSLLLLADYWFRPAGLILRFGTPGGAVEGPISSRQVSDAEQLAATVQQIRYGSPSNRMDSGSGSPPGGSPGLH